MAQMIHQDLIMAKAVSAHQPCSPRRAHVATAITIARTLEATDPSLSPMLVVAASYHDIGLATGMAVTRFHAIDGADLTLHDGFPEEVADAIRHHTGSFREMQLMRPDLAAHYGSADRMIATKLNRALTFCDTRAGSFGGLVTLNERLADIRTRRSDSSAIMTVMDEYEGRFHEIDKEFDIGNVIEDGFKSYWATAVR